ncbi:uncharacterized protein LOC107267070 [Cephus cinctus]|uniref:Uncharacterized protein LOC107267070 n=1 Tax=Cephus cinctus TaxID=211228 RepID=A0AAJ7FIS3_CEPCN|nr:uncharacterized protein LOC107267070 [Cephus cinctus]
MFYNWLDHANVFYANLTWFHIFSTFVSFFVVIATVWICHNIQEKETIRQKNDKDSPIAKIYGLQAQYKQARLKLAEQKLTPQQRSKEKEMESQTLTAVLQLLQERSDMFQVQTLDELKEQLSLYRSQ